MPDGKRLFQLVNTYPIKLADKTKVKPYFAMSDNLYDNGFAILTQVLDARKRVLQWGSVYPKEIELAKGDYTLLLQVEHADYKVLERMKSMAVGLEAQLGEKSKKLSLTVHRGAPATPQRPELCTLRERLMSLRCCTRFQITSTPPPKQTATPSRTSRCL